MTQASDQVVKDRIDALVQDEGLRPLSRRTGIPVGVIRAIQAERDISSSNLRRVSDVLGLEFYIGPPRSLAHSYVGTPVGIPTEGGTAFVDQFDLQVSAGAGSLGVAVPKEPIPFNANWLRRHGLRASEVAMLEVRGDSMEPILFDGDAVLVAKRSSKPKSGKMYVVARPDSVQVKWVTVLRSAVQLVSENDAYPPERVEGHDGPQFFRVCWFSHFLR